MRESCLSRLSGVVGVVWLECDKGKQNRCEGRGKNNGHVCYGDCLQKTHFLSLAPFIAEAHRGPS